MQLVIVSTLFREVDYILMEDCNKQAVHYGSCTLHLVALGVGGGELMGGGHKGGRESIWCCFHRHIIL